MTADRTAEQAYMAALSVFQAKKLHVGKGQTAKVKTKTGSDYTYDYADLTTITEAALPLLAEQGLNWSAAPDVTEAGFVLRYRLAHTDGHAEGGCYPLPDPSRSTPQEVGSAITYARRYALCAMTGLAPGGDDDDGQRASAARSAPKPTHTARTAPSDEPAVARAELAALCGERGWSTAEIADLFIGWDADHRPLPQADAATVREFTAKLRDGEVAP